MSRSLNADFSPLTDAKWPDAARDLLSGFAGKANVYRVMAHHGDLMAAWAPLREHVVRQTSLGPVFSEIVILRSAVRLGSDYEWAHHVSRARKLGLSDARIIGIRGTLDAMAPDDATLAGAVDALLDAKRLDEDTCLAVVALVGKAGVLDLIATVGFYSTLGYLLNSFQPPLDDVIAQELRDRPLS